MINRKWTSAALMVGVLGGNAILSPALADDKAIAAPLPAEGDASASEAAPEKTAGVETIVVTAQKRAEDSQEVPIAITALSGEDLAARGVKNMSDLAASVPGMSFGDVSGAPQIFARGVGFNTLTGVGESSIAVNVDGMYIEHPGAIGMLQRDLSRVEFLRGPQGTLYGHNAIGGVLNMITASPSDVTGAGASASYGDYNAYEVSGYATGQVTKGVRVRVYAEKDYRDGYVENLAPAGIGNSSYDGSRGITGRFSLDADLASNATFQLRLFHRAEQLSGPLYKPTNPAFMSAALGMPPATLGTVTSFDPWQTKLDEEADSDRSFSGGSGRFDVDFDAVQLVSISSFSSYRFKEKNYDGDGTLLPIYKIGPRHDYATTFTQEFNLLHNGAKTNWTLGAYYLHDKGDAAAYTPGPFSYNNLTWNRSDQTFDSASIFADITQKLTDDFSIYGGLRGLYEKTDFQHESYTGPTSAGLQSPPPPYAPGGSGWACTYNGLSNDGGGLGAYGDQDQDRTAMTGRAGATYQLAKRSNVYAQVSVGDKSGVYDNSSCTPFTKPENLTAYEVGSKNVFFGGTLQLNGALYYYDYKDVQIEEIVTPSIFYKSADARTFGMEFEAQWVPTDQLNFNLGVNLMSAKYTDFNNGDFLNLIVPGYNPNTDQSGHYLNRSPVYTVSFGAQYDQPLDFGMLTFRSDIYVSGSYYLRPYNLADDKQSAYTTVGGSISFTPNDADWTVRAFIKNATNRAVLMGSIASLPGQEGVYGAPRTFGVETSINF
ncbi:MAG TPA: TonB-dependent receptor [Parvibaculum sp.]|jgi:iron complex outermembrane receptor protein